MTPPPSESKFDDPTETLVRDLSPVRPLGAIVRVLDADAKPAVLRFSKGLCVVGSGANCDIVISQPTVSRRHAGFQLAPEGVLVRDLDSRNGVFYLGQRVERMVLSFGGRIQVGAVTLAIEVDTDALEQQLEVFEGETYRNMLGASASMRRLFAKLVRLEGSLVTVLVEGESGVGKELIAQALHEGSAVANGPLAVVNCGAVAKELVASELFGHCRGAFTGAHDSRRGAFDRADGGTLFLDEIGELPLDVQPMLLRALESGEVRPVGGDTTSHVKVRVVAATNRDLETEVKEGRFREDLYYRLAVVRLPVPPLRQRVEDIELLARNFAAAEGATDIPPNILERLRSRPWPGNVRELRNVIQAYTVLGTVPEAPRSADGALDALLSQRIDVARPYPEQKEEFIDHFTKIYLQQLLAHTAGNQTAAAKLAGLSRTYLGRLLAKHGLSRRELSDEQGE